MRIVALTTEDNPFDPFEDFKSWFLFDESSGYHTSGLVGRVSNTSEELTDEDKVRIIEEAIDYLIEINPFGNFKKVEKVI